MPLRPLPISSGSTRISSENSTMSASEWWPASRRRIRRKFMWARNISVCYFLTRRMHARPISSFRFLGSILTSQGSCKADIDAQSWRGCAQRIREHSGFRFPILATIWSASRWAQARNEALDIARDGAPVAEPFPRKADHDSRHFNPALIKAGARSWSEIARAAHQKAGRLGVVDEILALIRRAITKGQHGEPAG